MLYNVIYNKIRTSHPLKTTLKAMKWINAKILWFQSDFKVNFVGVFIILFHILINLFLPPFNHCQTTLNKEK